MYRRLQPYVPQAGGRSALMLASQFGKAACVAALLQVRVGVRVRVRVRVRVGVRVTVRVRVGVRVRVAVSVCAPMYHTPGVSPKRELLTRA